MLNRMVSGNRTKAHQNTFKMVAKSKMAANIYVVILIFKLFTCLLCQPSTFYFNPHHTRGAQYVVDVMRCMHKKGITDNTLTLLKLLCSRLDLDHGATSKKCCHAIYNN